jgi:hypothetical protein
METDKPTPPLPASVSRTSFPDPEHGSDRYVGPDVKSGDCCEKDRAIGRGEEITVRCVIVGESVQRLMGRLSMRTRRRMAESPATLLM